MKTDDLISIWKEYDNKLTDHTKVNIRLLKEVSIQKLKSGFAEFKFENIFELISSAIFAILLIGFLIDHFFVMRYAIPAAFLLVLMILAVVLNSWKLKQFYSISYITPVVEAQKKIERINYWDRIDLQSLYIVIPLFAAAFLIVFCKAILDLDLYELLGIRMWYFMLASFIVAIIIVWFLKRFPDKKMQKAIQFLDEIREFEK